jgi:hypothetical protein
MEMKKKVVKEKKYNEFATTVRRRGIKRKNESIFPDEEGVFPTPDKSYIVRIFVGGLHSYSTVAKFKDYDKAVERLKIEQKKQKEINEAKLKEYQERRKDWNYERPEPAKNLITGFDLKVTK